VASSIENYQDSPDYRDGLWALTNIDISKLSLKAKRINVTMPERLINTVDHYARNHRETRSGLLVKRLPSIWLYRFSQSYDLYLRDLPVITNDKT